MEAVQRYMWQYIRFSPSVALLGILALSRQEQPDCGSRVVSLEQTSNHYFEH